MININKFRKEQQMNPILGPYTPYEDIQGTVDDWTQNRIGPDGLPIKGDAWTEYIDYSQSTRNPNLGTDDWRNMPYEEEESWFQKLMSGLGGGLGGTGNPMMGPMSGLLGWGVKGLGNYFGGNDNMNVPNVESLLENQGNNPNPNLKDYSY
jgi:hypothetical protein